MANSKGNSESTEAVGVANGPTSVDLAKVHAGVRLILEGIARIRIGPACRGLRTELR